MPIESFWVQNYKAFGERTKIRVRPLTLLFGYNSVGKSALLRVLPLLSESAIGSTAASSPLALNSEAARGVTFDDLTHQQSSHPVISFGLGWRSVGGISGASFSIRDMHEFRKQVVERILVKRTEGSAISIDWKLPERIQKRRQTLPSKYIVHPTLESEEGTHRNLRFRGLLPDISGLARDGVFKEYAQADRSLRRYLSRVKWLKALRRSPERFEAFSGQAPNISEDGSGVAHLLSLDSLAGGNILAEVSQWFIDATKHRLFVSQGAFGGKELVSLRLIPEGHSGEGIEIVDTGDGMGQVLPVVTLLAMAKEHIYRSSTTFVFEHPELHLHPAAHATLANMFCQVAAVAGCPRMLVETHSENFLLRIQLAIARGDLDASRVIIHWVHQDEKGNTQVDEIELDDLGRPKGDLWPVGLFSENIQQSREIIQARKRRQTS